MHVLKHLSIVAMLLFSSVVIAQGVNDINQPIDAGVDISFGHEEKSKIWGLSLTEFEMYLRLREVDKSFSSENVTPYEVLGKHTTNAKDRKRYAAQYAEMYAANQVKTAEWAIAVQSAVDDLGISFQSMYKSSEAVQSFLTPQGLDLYAVNNLSKLPNDNEPKQSAISSVKQRNRATLFVETSCDNGCLGSVKEIIEKNLEHRFSGIDIVFSDTEQSPTDKEKIQAFARKLQLDQSLVKDKVITLNYDSARTATIRGRRSLPLLVDSTGKKV